MSVLPPIPFPGPDPGQSLGQSLGQHQGLTEQVAFHRTELSVILAVYGRMVAAGEWRDYAISHLREIAVFSVFRHSGENPLYRIEKRPKLRLKQGQYVVIGPEGQVLRRGHDLAQVVKVLEPRRFSVIE
jgi:hypothetical protein